MGALTKNGRVFSYYVEDGGKKVIYEKGIV